MVLIGLSILIASISLFCYKHPPSSWSFSTLLLRGTLGNPEKNSIAPAMNADEEESKEDTQENEKKADLDRQAMPPPPSKKPSLNRTASPPGTPKADAAVTFPIFTPDNTPSSTTPPSFPARNSIQRASRGCGPPRLNAIPAIQPPLRSPTSLPSATLRSPLPNRSPTSISSSLTLPPTHSTIPAKPRKKVILSPGRSPLDWAYISSLPNANLRGLPADAPYLRVPPSLLRQYTGRKGKDAWTVLGGKVYNITPYLPYHPGGEPELMKAAGRDGTKLFGEVHPWVNWEGMLEPCLVGVAVAQEEVKFQNQLEDMD